MISCPPPRASLKWRRLALFLMFFLCFSENRQAAPPRVQSRSVFSPFLLFLISSSVRPVRGRVTVSFSPLRSVLETPEYNQVFILFFLVTHSIRSPHYLVA
jgi:hypothetical protein